MWLFWGLTAGCFAVDRVAKLLASANLEAGMSYVVLGGLMRLELTRNTGMALGVLAGYQALIIALPVIAVLAGALALRRYRLTRFTRIASALIMGGFLGNLFDRLIYGYVLDMIFFPFLPFFVCNVADVAITIGVAMMAVSLIFRPNDWRIRDAKPNSPE